MLAGSAGSSSPPPTGAARPVHCALIRARLTDADVQGANHHSAYLKWLEEARLGWLRACGVPYRRNFADRGLAIVVAELSIQYLRPTTFEDQILVTILLQRASRVRLALGYELHRAAGELVATAQTKLAFVNMQGQPVRLPREHPLLQGRTDR